MVRKITVLLLTAVAFLVCGAGNSNYYNRIDTLLGSTAGVMVQAIALPIITGAVDETRGNDNDDKRFYSIALNLADRNNNYAWRAYQNSRKLSKEYVSAKVVDIAEDKSGSGANAQFLDQSSGDKYNKKEKRFLKISTIKIFRKGVGSTDLYIENIGVPPAQLLEDIFSVEIPTLPSLDEQFNNKNIPIIHVEPLDKFKERIEKTFEEDESADKGLWKVYLIPKTDNFTKHSSKTIFLENNQAIEIGVRIMNPEGKYIVNKSDLGCFQPYVTSVGINDDETFLKIMMREIADKERVNNSFRSEVSEITVINDEFPYITPGVIPLIVNYKIPVDVDVVEMNIIDSQGNIVYVLKESKPDPINPVPLIWNGKIKNAEGIDIAAANGDYTIILKSHAQNDRIYSTKPKMIKVIDKKKEIENKIKALLVENNGNNDEYGSFIITNENIYPYGSEKIYVWLHGSESGNSNPISSSLICTFSKFDISKSKILSETTEVSIHQRTAIKVLLNDKYGNPISNAQVRLFSRRNNQKIIDKFEPDIKRTDSNGESIMFFNSQIPGEAEIFAMSDMVWINEKPLVVKVK